MFSMFQPEDESGQLDYRYDEFGFKVEEEGKKNKNKNEITNKNSEVL